MYLLILGLLLAGLKLAGVAPVADWSWWWVLAPFGLAILWWAWSDYSGRTRRKAQEQEAQRQAQRVEENRRRLHAGRPEQRR